MPPSLIDPTDLPDRNRPGAFPQTRWSLVLDAQNDDAEALARLCTAYWQPLFCYACRLRPEREDARDLTQAFFESLLSRDSLRLAREDRGKLRNFLLVALKRFAVGEWRRESSQKRGGGLVLGLDALDEAGHPPFEASTDLSPEREFDRAWARQLLSQVLERLGELYSASGKRPLFDALRDRLTPGEKGRPYAEIGAELGLPEPVVRFAAFEMRGRYRDLLKQAIAETVTTEAEAAEELMHLRAVFA